LAHFVAEDHIGVGVAGFALASFAVAWAWACYSWLASAYDTDDWVFRLATRGRQRSWSCPSCSWPPA